MERRKDFYQDREYHGRLQQIMTAVSLLAAALAAGRVIFVSYRLGVLYTFGIFYLAILIGTVCMLKKALFLREVFFSVWTRILLAYIFTGFQVLGLYYSTPGMEETVGVWELLLWTFCFAPLTFGAQNMLFAWVRRLCGRAEPGSCQRISGREERTISAEAGFFPWKSFWTAYGVILAGFMIPFAAYYPAIMAYDVIPQLDQIKISGYTTHHPLIHTLMLAGSLKVGEMLPVVHNADRAGLAVYTILQMLIVAGCFAYVSVYLRKKGVSKYICYLFVLCAAFYPTHGMLAVSITKDTVYAALVMLFTVFVWELVTTGGRESRDGDGQQDRRRVWMAAYWILTVLLLLFRNNSIYAWILYLIVVSIGLYGKASRESVEAKRFAGKISLIHVTALLAYLALHAGMVRAVEASSATYAREMLSVPAQQIARAAAYHEDELTEEDRERLAVVWGEDVLPEYVPAIADRSKRDIDGSSEVLEALLSEWVSLGIRYPGEYLEAFLLKNKGMWYLEDSSYLYDIYSYAKGYLQITYPSDQQEYVQALVPGYARHQRLQFLQAVYRYFAGGDAVWKYVPPFSLVMQPAFYCWLLFYYLVCCIGLKKGSYLIPAIYLIALAGTLLLGPCVLVRYVYPLMLAVTALVLLAAAELRFDSVKIR